MRFILAFVLVFSTIAAQADVIFSPGISYSTFEEENNGVTGESERITYDFRLGYLHPSGLYLGGMYSMINETDNDGYSVAGSLGYQHYSGFYATFHYHLMGEMDRSATVTMTDGMGPQIDLGWVFPITHMFFIGPQMTYRSINYKKQDSGGTTTDIDITRSYMMPYVTLWFKF